MAEIADHALPRDELWLPAMLVAVAVMGKSAQFPFHTWLPDAMPGPTPISALIHAATMVAAGVFLVARVYPLFLSSPAALTLLAGVAAITMFIAALSALATDDLKRVLAWSTVSQLAYMFGALAAGAWSAAVLHLLAHGAFKALLFLSAGSVVHAVGGATTMDRMGGLREKLPDTFVTMTIGFGALAGVVPLVGFFTKDAVIAGALDEASSGRLVWPWVAWVLVVSMVVTAVLTVAYSMRAWLLVFFGEAGPDEVHEAPATMRVPLYLLSVPTVLGGLMVVDPARLLGPEHDEELFHGRRVGGDDRAGGGDRGARAGRVEPARSRHVAARGAAAPAGGPALRRRPGAAGTSCRAGRPRGRPGRRRRLGHRLPEPRSRGLGRLLRLGQTGNVQTYLMVVVVGATALAVAAGVLA